MGILMLRLIFRAVVKPLFCVEEGGEVDGLVVWLVGVWVLLVVGVVLVGGEEGIGIGVDGNGDGIMVGVVSYAGMAVIDTSIEVVVWVVSAEVKELTSVDELTIAVDTVEELATTLDELETPIKVVTESVRAEAVASKFREAEGTSSLLRLNSGL